MTPQAGNPDLPERAKQSQGRQLQHSAVAVERSIYHHHQSSTVLVLLSALYTNIIRLTQNFPERAPAISRVIGVARQRDLMGRRAHGPSSYEYSGLIGRVRMGTAGSWAEFVWVQRAHGPSSQPASQQAAARSPIERSISLWPLRPLSKSIQTDDTLCRAYAYHPCDCFARSGKSGNPACGVARLNGAAPSLMMIYRALDSTSTVALNCECKLRDRYCNRYRYRHCNRCHIHASLMLRAVGHTPIILAIASLARENVGASPLNLGAIPPNLGAILPNLPL
eukprot:gene24524-biopygen20902